MLDFQNINQNKRKMVIRNLTNVVGWIIVGLLILFNLCYTAYKHEKPKTGNYNFWSAVISSILSLLLYLLMAW
jgi:hypothetical protein